MKSFIVALVIVCVVVVAGTIIYLERQKIPSIPAPIVESSPEQTQPEKIVAPKQEELQTILENTNETVQIPVANSVSKILEPETNTVFSKAIDTLVSRQASFQQKQAAWKQLGDAGELDQAIEALKQSAANNPASAEYPTALGEGYLQKAGVVSENGGSINEMGILGMQADQSFDAALKLDPQNWEAQFNKANTMSFWPVELNKSDEVIQRFASLIDQQETMTLQPEFAHTYVVLGNEYQKTGQPDKAAATWQLGLAKYPNDPALQKKISVQ